MSSKQVDERVVQMKFDNADFQKKTAETISTLDKLKAATNLDGFKGLKNVNDSIKGMDMSGVSKSVDECSKKFSALEIAGVTAIAKITSSAMDMGIKFVKSMSIDRVADGFSRYAQKTAAVQTIMAATAKDFSDVGTQMAYVNDQLTKLAWFTDETSYSFNEMVNNIGKFTSNNIKLDQAVTAMQGISTWAAVSGANINDANRAMYNLSQAVGAGSVKLIDWKSIENANMATYDFKKNVAETAVQMGTLSRAGDGVYKTLKGTTFTLAQFNQELDKGWFSSEVLLNTLNKYGGATEILYKLYDATGKTTKSILDNAEKFKNGDADFIKKWAEDSETSVEELTDLFTQLTDAQNELGLKSFRAAQEAKTFQEAIDATAEAVGSKWMQTFEYIFGNYEEAKKLWSGLAEFLYEEFASTGDVRNDILKSWKEVGEVEGDVINGRNELLRATVNLLNLIIKPLRSMKQAFSDAFDLENARDIGNSLAKTTKAFADFTERIQPTQKVLQAFYATARSVSEVFKTVTYLIGSFIRAIAPGVEPVQQVGDGLAGIVITMNKYIYVAAKMIQNSKTIPMIFNAIGSALRLCYTIFVKVGTYVGGGLVFAFSKLKTVIQNVAKLLSGLGAPLANLGNSFAKFKSFVSDSIRQNRALSTVFASEKDQLKDVKDAVIGAAESTRNLSEETTFLGRVFAIVIGTIKEFPKVIMTIAGLIGGVLLKIVTTIGNVFKKVFKTIYDDFKDANSIGEGFKNLIEDIKEGIKGMLENLGINGDSFFTFIDNVNEKLKELFAHITIGKVLAIAFSVAMIVMMSNITNVAKTISTAIGAFGTLAGNINKILKNKFLTKATPILEVAKAFALVAASLALLSAAAKEGGLEEATSSMLKIIFAIGGFAIALKLLDAVMSKLGIETVVPSWSRSMVSLAASVGILSLALIALNKVSLESWDDFGQKMLPKLASLIILMGGFVGMAIALSKWSKDLPKASLSLLAAAGAVAILANALNKLDDINVNDSAMTALSVLLAGMVAVILAAEKIKLRQALGLLVIAAAFRLALPAIEELAELMNQTATKVAESDKFAQYIATFIVTLGIIIGLAVVATRAVTPLVQALGSAVVEIGVGVFLISQAAVSLEELAKHLNIAQLAKVVVTVGALTGVIIAFIAALKVINGGEGVFSQRSSLKQLIGISVLMLSFAASMKILVSSLEELANVYATGGLKSLIVCTGVIAALTLVLTQVIKAAGKCESAKSAIVAMIAIMSSLSILLISLTILTMFDWYELITPTIALGGLMFVLGTVFEKIAKIKNVKLGVVLAMVGSLLILAGSLVVLATQPIGNVFTAMVALGAIMGLLTTVIETISGKSGLANTKKIGVLIAISGMLLIASGSLVALSAIPWNSMWPALIGMGAAFAAVLGATFVLSKIPAVNPITLVSFGIMSACVLAFAATAKVMEGIDAFDFLKKMGIIVLALSVLTGISIIDTAVSAGLWALSGVMVAFGAAVLLSSAGFSLISSVFKELQNVDLLSVAGGLAAMAGSLLLLTIPAALLGIVSLSFLGLAVALGAVSLASLGIETFVSSMERLANLDVLGLSVGMLSLSGSLVAISALSLGLPIVALALMTLAGGVAAVSLASLGFGTFADAIERLGNVNILGMAGGLSALALPLVTIAALGFSLPVAAAGITMLSASLAMFSGSLGMVNVVITGFGESVNLMLGFFNSMVTGVSNFLNRIWQFLTFIPRMLFSSSQTTAQVASKSGQLVGSSYIEGFNDGAGFHSPPERLVEFEDAVEGEFSGNTSMASAAAQSGQNVGQSWGSKLWETIKSVFGKIIDAIKGLFKKIGGIADDLDLDLGFDANSFNFEMPDFQSMLGDGSSYMDQFNQSLEAFSVTGLNADDVMADLETQMGDLTGATGAGAAAMGDYGDATEGAGKSAKKTKAELTDMEKTFQNLAESMTNASDGIKGFKSVSASNPFEAYEEKEVIDPKNVIENMKNISKTTSGWMDNLNLLFRRGVHTNLLKYLEELGIEGRDMVEAFVKMSDEQLEEAQGLFNHNLGYSEENAQSMLNSMHRKLDQVQQWGHNIKTLIERGLDEGIVKKLTDLGPDSADQVAAFASMTEDQLIEANAMFTAAMQISADGAGSIIASFAETGDTAAQEFIQGINDGKYGYIEAGQGMGLAVLNALKESLDEHSPSEETRKVGEYAGQGLNNGMAGTYTQVSRTAYGIAQAVLNDFSVTLSYDKLYKLGENAMAGLKAGIENKGAEAVSVAEGIAAKCAEIMAKKWDEHSPSKVMMKLGRFFSEGAAIGIEAGAKNMYNAAAIAAEGTVGAFEDVTSQVNDAIAFNCNPIITPKLDLSYIRSQMAEINSMFNDGTVGVNGNPQNGGKSSGQNGQQQITFTQNNYSPKALSRTEIYRYTHNQLSMAGGYIR